MSRILFNCIYIFARVCVCIGGVGLKIIITTLRIMTAFICMYSTKELYKELPASFSQGHEALQINYSVSNADLIILFFGIFSLLPQSLRFREPVGAFLCQLLLSFTCTFRSARPKPTRILCHTLQTITHTYIHYALMYNHNHLDKHNQSGKYKYTHICI